MTLRWSARARSDLVRLQAVLAPINPLAAVEILRLLQNATERLLEFPRIGARLESYEPREVRRLIVAGRYELRYEIRDDSITVVRLFHVREDR
jgi:plasmid stabilization system protein ParE